jgi:hypothetical protein
LIWELRESMGSQWLICNCWFQRSCCWIISRKSCLKCDRNWVHWFIQLSKNYNSMEMLPWQLQKSKG